MNTIIFTPFTRVEKLKQKAKKLKKKLGISHHDALDQAAYQSGYHHWHHVTKMAAITATTTAATEAAFRNGVLVAYDFSDISDCDLEGAPFVEDDLAMNFCKHDLLQAYLQIDDEEDPEFHDLPEEEKCRYFESDYGSFAILRFTGVDIPQDVEGVLKSTREFIFWPPQFIWIKGVFSNTYGTSVTDSNGGIVGVIF